MMSSDVEESCCVDSATCDGPAVEEEVPIYAFVSEEYTVGSFCMCSGPSYVSNAPPFCWSSSAAMLAGTYKCKNCSQISHDVWSGGAYVDPYYCK